MSKEAQLSFKAVLKVCHSRVIRENTSHCFKFLQLHQVSMCEKMSVCYPNPNPPPSTHLCTRGKGNERPHLKPTIKSQLNIFFYIVFPVYLLAGNQTEWQATTRPCLPCSPPQCGHAQRLPFSWSEAFKGGTLSLLLISSVCPNPLLGEEKKRERVFL